MLNEKIVGEHFMNVSWPIYYFVFALFFFVAILLAYLKAAKRWSLFDAPNERSSHKQITIRGAGVIYLVGILFYFVLSNSIFGRIT